jgi:hypothetical protein
LNTIITSQLFDAYIKCPGKCYRIFKGQFEKTNSYAEWLRVMERAYFGVYLNNKIRVNAEDRFNIINYSEGCACCRLVMCKYFKRGTELLSSSCHKKYAEAHEDDLVTSR